MNGQTHDSVRAVAWVDGKVRLIDQRRLPAEEQYLDCDTVEAVADAIRDMVVRGAPAIGITAAYGVVLAATRRFREHGEHWRSHMGADMRILRQARPTAVNLNWALRRMREGFDAVEGDPHRVLLDRALRIHEQDIEANRRMGALGAELLDGGAVLTHCNTGSLATGGYGTALGVIRSGVGAGRIERVFADETRPWLQGSRLTAWELLRDRIAVTMVCEGAAAALLRAGSVSWVLVGADRIAANGDVANKIGTYSLAVNARHHGVRFMVVAPTSTIDMDAEAGSDIPVEQRDAAEVLGCRGVRVAPQGAGAWNPVFDVTPAGLIDAIVTERGVITDPDAIGVARLMHQ